MFKQCCGCKSKGDDTDDEKKEPEKDEEKAPVKKSEEEKVSVKEKKVDKVKEKEEDKVSVKEKEENKVSVKEKKEEDKVSVKEKEEEDEVSVKEEKEVKKDEVKEEKKEDVAEAEKQTKNPGLTVNTDPYLETLEEYDDNAIVPITPRTAKGLTPHPAKRNSTPGLSAIPRWLSQEDEEEAGGTAEPPVTPVGRDELALRRHRFFSDLLVAAQAATEHRVRFDPLGPSVAGQDNPLSPAVELNSLLTRLENVTSRLEKTVSAGDSPKTLTHSNSATQVNYSPPPSAATMSSQVFQDIMSGPLSSYLALSAKIGAEVAAQAKLVGNAFQTQLQYLRPAEARTTPSQSEQSSLLQPTSAAITAVQELREKNRTSVMTQLQYLRLAEARTAPSQLEQSSLLQPTSAAITAVQELREKNRTSQYFNHLSAISESIPALGWVTVSPAPAPYIKEMNDAGQFYTNRVLKDWKQKDQTHVDWVKAWIETLTELQAFVKQHHTTGLVWSKTNSGGVPPPPPPAGLPPPPPPLDSLFLSGDDGSNDRSALFAEINKGEDITKSLKKVTSDMQTHKNPGLRSGPAPFKPSAPASAPAAAPGKGPASNKPPVFARDGKKWLVEHQRGNKNLVVEGAEMNNVVYMYGCLDSTLTVKGKVNSIFLDSCRKSAVVFDSLVSSVEFVNCQSVQMQVLGKVPTISIDKTDGCQMYLSPDSLDVEIVSSKSSEMNVLVPKGNGDFTEFPIPEQFKTTVSKSGLSTVVVESKG